MGWQSWWWWCTIAMTALLGVLVQRLVAGYRFYTKPEPASQATTPFSKDGSTETGRMDPNRQLVVPFIVLERVNWHKVLAKALELHEQRQSQALQALSRLLQLSLDAEEDYDLTSSTVSGKHQRTLLSTKLQDKIRRLADLYEAEVKLLRDEILLPIVTTQALSSGPFWDRDSKEPVVSRRNDSTFDSLRPPVLASRLQPSFWSRPTGDAAEGVPGGSLSASYDTVEQILAHLVRDWSSDGASLRAAIYPWVEQQLHQHVPAEADSSSSSPRVFVPGAGLGRLAWQVAQEGYHVEAVESSFLMCAVAAFVFRKLAQAQSKFNTTKKTNSEQHTRACQVTIFPYTLDSFRNEVDSQRRYDGVQIPDLDALNRVIAKQEDDCSVGSLSYTIHQQDWTSLFLNNNSLHRTYSGHLYHATITCYFLDTATHVYDTIFAIYQALHPNGLWINVGPLQWHRNAQIQLSADELKDVIIDMGFSILEWKMDTSPLDYRNQNVDPVTGTTRSTHGDVYYPLRFVARKSSRDKHINYETQ